MKGKFLLALALMLLFVPAIVKADYVPVSVKGHTEEIQTTVGSDVQLQLWGTYKFDGTITYNSNELELKSYDVGISTTGAVPGKIKVEKNEPGTLTFTFDKDGSENERFVFFTFTVKAASSTGNVAVTYTPNDPTVLGIDGSVKSVKQEYKVVTTKCDCPKCATNTATVDNSSSTLMTYAPWALSGVLFIALVIVALKRNDV